MDMYMNTNDNAKAMNRRQLVPRILYCTMHASLPRGLLAAPAALALRATAHRLGRCKDEPNWCHKAGLDHNQTRMRILTQTQTQAQTQTIAKVKYQSIEAQRP